MKSIKDFFSRREAAVPVNTPVQVAVPINTPTQASDETLMENVNKEEVPQLSCDKSVPEHFQPREDYIFPRKAVGKKMRSCQASWFKKFPWLHYDQAKDSVFCILCLKHHNKLIAEHNKKDAYVTKGFNSWKKAPAAFSEHQQCKAHTAALTYEFVVPKCGDIIELTVSELEKKRVVERRYLLKVMESICYLARQGIALRGDDGNDNLTQLLKLVCKGDGDILKRLDCESNLQSGQQKYLHNDIQNELLQLMAKQVLLKKLESVRSCKFFALMADEYTDISNKELLSICLRWVEEDLSVHEDFVGFYEILNIRSESILMGLKDSLVRMSLPLQNLRGQAYDGASNMLGTKSGVAVQIAAEQPKALATHCQGHSLNLGIKRTMTNSKIMKDVMGTVMEIISLVKHSPKREKMLGDIKDLIRYESQLTNTPENNVAPALNKLCPTRWTVRGNAYLKIIDNYDTLMKLWDVSLTTGSLDSDIKARIIGVQNQMQEFQFFYGLHLSQRLFSISDNLSRSLQNKAISALSGLHLAELTIETYKDMRSDDNAELFFKTVANKALNNNLICMPQLPRKRKRPNYKSIVENMQVDGYEGTNISYSPNTSEDHFRVQYFECLDLIISSIEDRFNQPAFTAFLKMEEMLLNILKQKDYASELQYVERIYGADIDPAALQTEAFSFYTMLKSVCVNTFDDVVNQLRSVPLNQLLLIPNIIIIVNLILVNPATSCTAERSFSTARRLKTWLRASMTTERFNNLAILTTHKDLTDTLDVIAVGNQFVDKHNERKSKLGKFVPSDLI